MRITTLLTLALLTVTQAAQAQARTSKFGIPSTSGAGGVQLLTSTVAQLPTCDVSHLGMLRAVVDATTPTYNGALVGGGAVRVAVMCNGTSWTSQ